MEAPSNKVKDIALGPDDLCLCCGTIARAPFEELVEAASEGGFRAISLCPNHYQDALERGLSAGDMRRLLEEHNLAVSGSAAQLDARCT